MQRGFTNAQAELLLSVDFVNLNFANVKYGMIHDTI